MIKKLVKVMLLGLLLLFVSKGFIAVTTYQVISEFKEQHASKFLFTYQWISSSLDGRVSIKGVEITPYAMKKTFSIDEINIAYDDYLSLLSNLSAIKKGQLTGLKEVSLPLIQTPLSGKGFKELLAESLPPVWFTPFNLYGCGEYTALSAKEYELMGIKQQKMSLLLDIKDVDKKLEKVILHLDGYELGELNVALTLPSDSFQRVLKNEQIDDLTFHSLNIEYQDAGYFRRLNILCNQTGLDSRAVFSMTAASQWKDAMFSKGLLVNEVLIQTYADYLLQGGTLSIDAKMEEGFKLGNLASLVDKELFSSFDTQLSLNGKVIKQPQLFPDSTTLFPPPVIELESKPKMVDLPKRQAGYRTVAIEMIAEYIERKIRVVMSDGKLYEGRLTSTTEYNLELTQNVAGGAVHYPLMLNQIDTVEVWFNQEN